MDTSKAEKNDRSPACPFLGLRDDSETALACASSSNYCHRSRPVAPVKLEYQNNHCLTAAFVECAVYQNKPGFPLPNAIRNRLHRTARGRWLPALRLGTVLILLVMVAVIAWLGDMRGMFHSPVMEKAATQAKAFVPPVTPTQSTPLVVPAHSPSPLPSLTPFLLPVHALETPIGVDVKFIIHRVREGENLDTISRQFGTTNKAVLAVNYGLSTPIQPDDLLVVPFNRTDVTGLPTFQVYRVEKDIPAAELARQLAIDFEMLNRYNDLNDAMVLVAGEWVLIPHMGTSTP